MAAISPLLAESVRRSDRIGQSRSPAVLGCRWRSWQRSTEPIVLIQPFGLVLIEAMANGTPVIAFGRGSVPEIIDHGVTGFIVNSVDEAVAAIPLAKTLDRRAIRRRFEERFSVERMARDYLTLYSEILRRGTVDAVLNPTVRLTRWRTLPDLTKPMPREPARKRSLPLWRRLGSFVKEAQHFAASIGSTRVSVRPSGAPA
jgi:Glycosyl transferases group 1